MNPEMLEITPGDGAAIAVPSGQDVTLIDIIWNSEGPEGPAPRFRFLAPAIARSGGRVDFDAAMGDLRYLCEGFAQGQLAAAGRSAPMVLMAMSDRPVEFGVPDPEATQYVEVFRIEGTTCISEIF